MPPERARARHNEGMPSCQASRHAGQEQEPDILQFLAAHGARTVPELARALACPRASLQTRLDALARQGRAAMQRQGAHVYWRAMSPPAPERAQPLPDAVRRRWQRPALQPLKRARSCYGHLAGELGVLQLQALQARGLLVVRSDHLLLTDAGLAWLADHTVAMPASAAPLPLCLDWSERRSHLGGWLGRALLQHHLDRGWLQDGARPRSLQLTAAGRRCWLPWLQAVC